MTEKEKLLREFTDHLNYLSKNRNNISEIGYKFLYSCNLRLARKIDKM